MDEASERDPWDLSAIESLVLLNGPSTSEVAAVHMAILELVVRRVLTLTTDERRMLLIFRKSTDRLSPGPAFNHELPAPLKMVRDRYRGHTPSLTRGRDSSVAVEDFARNLFGPRRRRTLVDRLRRKVQPDPTTFVESVMMPHLRGLGLFHWTEIQYEGLYRGYGWEITPAGAAELDRLHAIMADGRESFPRWVREEPERASRFIEQAGAALLLIPGIAPSIRELNLRISGRTLSSPDVARMTVNLESSGVMSAPLNAFALVALAGVFGPRAFDGLDSAFHSISEDVSQVWTSLMASGSFFYGE
jgi:hypothetical protein